MISQPRGSLSPLSTTRADPHRPAAGTSGDDPVLSAVRTVQRPAVVHGGLAFPELDLVSIDNRAAAREVGALAFAGARRPAVVNRLPSRDQINTISTGADITEVLLPVVCERLEGYREAAESTGCHPR